MRLLSRISILALFTVFTACQNEELPLDRATRKVVDTLYREEVRSLSQELDSACQILEDSIFPILLDSIIEKRRIERDAILKNRR